MGLSADIRRQLIESFKTEQGEHIQTINQGLLALEKNPDSQARQALLDEIFREAHSLKGAARAVGMTTIESLGHSLEEVLLCAKEGRLTFSPELFDLLYQGLDAVELVMQQVEAGNSTPPANVLTLLAQLEEAAAQAGENQPKSLSLEGSEEEPSAVATAVATDKEETLAKEAVHEPAPGPTLNPEVAPDDAELSETQTLKSDETIRVSVGKLDALMAQFSELLGAKIRAEQRLAEVREIQNFTAEWQKKWATLRTHYNRVIRNGQSLPPAQNGLDKDMTALVDFTSHNHEQLRAINTQSNVLYRQLANDTLRLSLIIDELQEEIKRVRMLPLSTITATFGRMVRDLAREQNKQINLTVTGSDTELDKRVLEQIKDPLIHLLRNAVDHGLETASEREQAGKAEEGQILLSAAQQGNNVVINVADDGRGLDLAAIRRSAVDKGVLRMADAEKLSDAETADLIFNSGLSTNKIITDISGRGVGLDVVRQNVEELHGILEVNFSEGQGTTFTMTLPLTLASSRGLLVQIGEQIFALPLTNVERMLYVEQRNIASVEGKAAMTYEGRPVALAWLADLLELPRDNQPDSLLTVVVIGVAEKRLGLIVDRLVGEQEIVMKGLGKQLAKVGGFAGATVLGSGQVVLVLHTADLIKLAAQTSVHTPANGNLKPQNGADKHKTILIVDDSITTRTLEKNILEAAGYQVKLATNGEEAIGLLASSAKLPHLVVSDVNMPRLDGFGLTHRIKQDTHYASLPVILVTSLDTPTDKARGIEVGADAYIVKSQFDQGSLLETIEQLIG